MVGSNIVLLVSVIVFISSALIVKEENVLSVRIKKDQSQIQPSPTPKPTGTPFSSPTPSIQFSPKPTPKPVIPSPNPTSSNNPTPIPNTNTSSNAFIYPNSIQISSSGEVVTLESSDSPSVITDWYKNKIKEQGMKTTSFVTTSTNGNVLNKLAGASSTQNVQITITKKTSDSKTKIEISNLNP